MRLFLTLILFSRLISAQNLLGPMHGNLTDSSITIWVHDLGTNTPELQIPIKGGWTRIERLEFGVSKFHLNKLTPNTKYDYTIISGSDTINRSFRTLPKYYKTSFNKFSFTIGSCFYVNDPRYDVTNTPYGKDLSILNSIAKTKSEFFIWGGDAVYYKNPDLINQSSMVDRFVYTRKKSETKSFLQQSEHYFIWDDHDFGPNNSNTYFEGKDASLKAFINQTANPYYGTDSISGNFYSFQKHNVKFICLDNRTYRTIDTTVNSIYLGDQQLNWLYGELKNSTADFNIIIGGSQFSNFKTLPEAMCLSEEWNQLKDFISKEKIEGVVFMSGDRHFSEVLKTTDSNHYPLYEFTCSPVTSKAFDLATVPEFANEINNPLRIGERITINNYAQVKFLKLFGKKMFVIYRDKSGKKISCFKVKKKELSF